MPLYEFHCRECEHTFETLVTTRESKSVACPECESASVERLIGLPARPVANDSPAATNCRGDGPPCDAPMCGRKFS